MLKFRAHHRRGHSLFLSSSILAFLLVLLPLGQSSVPANASPSNTSPNAECVAHCYGKVAWLGATFGAKTNVFVQNLSVPAVWSNFLTEEMWLGDTNTGAWTEIGYYSGYPSSWNDISYFYAFVPPGGTYSVSVTSIL